MNRGQLSDFAGLAQAKFEELWPIEVLFEGMVNPAAASSAISRQGGPQLLMGGMLSDNTLTIRVRLAALNARPVLNKRVQWRRPGDSQYHTLAISKISEPDPGGVLVIDTADPDK